MKLYLKYKYEYKTYATKDKSSVQFGNLYFQFFKECPDWLTKSPPIFLFPPLFSLDSITI